MPEAVLTFDAAQLPEGTCFATEQERLDAFVAAMRGSLPGNYSTVNTGSTTPAADDRDKAWLRTNGDGSPDGTYYFFDGTWKRAHPLPSGVVMLWTGIAAAIDTLDGGSAGIATAISGPFWEIDTSFAGKFPVGVGAFASGAAVAVGATGGEEKHVLTVAELAEHSHGPLGTNADGIPTRVTSGGTGALQTGTLVKIEDTTANTGSSTAHNTLPPYVGTYMIKRSVRTYFSI